MATSSTKRLRPSSMQGEKTSSYGCRNTTLRTWIKHTQHAAMLWKLKGWEMQNAFMGGPLLLTSFKTQ